ncbi:MAG: hypothetical protein AAB874_03240 [Patescibacteria group bacterium]
MKKTKKILLKFGDITDNSITSVIQMILTKSGIKQILCEEPLLSDIPVNYL